MKKEKDSKNECSCENESKEKHKCGCSEDCTCGDECKCHEEERCSDQCDCNKNEESKEKYYLDLAQRLQAEFENFRKRSFFEMKKAREDGQISVIEVFLPCLDTFKVAKKSITDPQVLEGVEMIESSIQEALKKLEVEKIEAVGKKYDPNLHSALAVASVKDKENDIILEEYQAGYKFKDRVIRYSKVIVNKKED